MDPTTQAHPPTPTPALSLLLSEKALEATRTEILVLASGMLFLASPVFLLVWILYRVGAKPAVPEKEERKVSIVLPTETEPSAPATDDTHDEHANATGNSTSNGNEDSLLRLRRSSTWGGRSAQPGSHPRGRRKSAGSRRGAYDSDNDDDEEDVVEGLQGAQTSLSSPGLGPEPQPEIGHAALAAFGGMGRVAAAVATPATLLLPSGGGDDGGSVNDGGDEATELREFDPPRPSGEAGFLGDSIEKPPSPRSPRVLAADQAAMMDALCAEDGEDADWKAAVPSPVGSAGRDSLDLASGFDDPLGVNKLVDLPAKDEERLEEVELELRSGGSQGS